MEPSPTRYIPALRFDWLTPLFDPLVRTFLPEQRIRRRFVEQIALRPGHRLLDLGCGTATLAGMLAVACPAAEVIGIDGDPKVLAIGREKLARAGLRVELQEAMVDEPPFEPSSFDRVVSSLVFHHLARETKHRALRRAHALLAPGGELHILDWGRADGLLMRIAYLSIQLFDGFATTTDNVRGRLPAFIEEAGFTSVEETHRMRTVFGPLSLYRAVRP
jgi:cyclopropane fatty-acyl-phospholipid synthase-like methyltransferase